MYTIEGKELDYLIFSSHKTATQTITNTLNQNGIKAIHCHSFYHFDDKTNHRNAILNYLRDYKKQFDVALKIITVYREPIERHISSFFQGYGTRPINRKEVSSYKETLIYQKSVSELIEMFIHELKRNTLIGISDSIKEFSKEVGLDIGELKYDRLQGYGVHKAPDYTYYFFSFDDLSRQMGINLTSLTGQTIKVSNHNQHSSKFYSAKYVEFKQTIKIPKEVIGNIYENNKELINLFYKGEFHELLQRALLTYSI